MYLSANSECKRQKYLNDEESLVTCFRIFITLSIKEDIALNYLFQVKIFLT